MTDHLQHYTITITAEGPLFIGSGQSIGKKEYLFDPRRKRVSVPDMPKMCRFLQERRLMNAYESFMIDRTNGAKDLSAWLRSQNIQEQECRPWIAYSIDSGDAVFEDRGKKEIAAFVKDPFGCPYVPGSSLKGALRTVLLAAAILDDPKDFQSNQKAILDGELSGGRQRVLKREVDQLEQKTFYTLGRDEKIRRNAVNDMLSGLRIGDSAPLSVEDLTLCQKIDVLPDGQQRRLPILRECLKPGTVLRFPLTIDPRLFSRSPKELLQAAESFVQNYDRCYLRAFPVDDILGGGNLYLGGGSGFVSKTVLYPLLGERGLRRTGEILSQQFRNHRHNQDIRRGVSPHTLKCTKYQSRLYEMGACTMEIE